MTHSSATPTGPRPSSTARSDRGDAEQYIDRLVFAPATRSYTARAWVYPAVDTPDSALDRLVGVRSADSFNSSSRFQDQPAYRASSAFDPSARLRLGRRLQAGRGARSVGFVEHPEAADGQPASPGAVAARRGPPADACEVELAGWFDAAAQASRPGGVVTLPSPARARAFRLTILEASFPPGTSAADRQAPAVGIGHLAVPGLAPVTVPRSGPLRAGCGSIAIEVAGHRLAMRPAGTVAELDQGMPLRASSCGPPVTMPAGVAGDPRAPRPVQRRPARAPLAGRAAAVRSEAASSPTRAASARAH